MTKELKILSNAMDLNAEITILIKYSPKREQMLEQIEELPLSIEDESERNQANRISKLSTRWTVRAKCFQRILEKYSYLYELWSKCLEEPYLKRDVKARIIGCKVQMEGFDLYFGLKLGKLLYSHIDKLSQALQNEKMSAVSSKSLAKLTIDTIAGIQNEESFNAIYDVAVKESKNIPFVEEPVLKRKRKASKYSVLNFAE